MVENNIKFVREKSKAREYIKDDWSYHYNMVKPDKQGCDCILKAYYQTIEELDTVMYETI